MDDYIEREAFLKTWCESYCRPKQNCRDDCSFYDAITQFPVADVRENVRGEWVFEEQANQHRCSVCGCDDYGEGQQDGTVLFNHYCPNCGADMRGGEKDD